MVPDKRPSDAELRKMLTPEQYHVLFEKGTEAPFTGEYVDDHQKGMFKCAVCGTVLFDSDAKFDSGTGWPSFDRPADLANVILQDDLTGGMKRTEVICKHCGAHLGHVFDDGPKETTGQRFCINSCALKLDTDAKK